MGDNGGDSERTVWEGTEKKQAKKRKCSKLG